MFPIIWVNNKLYLINVKNITRFYYYGVLIFYFGILTTSKKYKSVIKINNINHKILNNILNYLIV